MYNQHSDKQINIMHIIVQMTDAVVQNNIQSV